MKKIHNYLARTYHDIGLLLLRLGIGLQLAFHGWPKITAGPEKWEKIGSNMALVGLDFGHVFWGFMASFGEFGGGLLMILGLFSRPAAFLAGFTMFIAAMHHWHEVYMDENMSLLHKWMSGSNAFELMIVCAAWYFLGSGKYSLDKKLLHKQH